MENNKHIKTELINVLNCSTINHKKEITKELDIKNAHIYCKINKLNGQLSGSLIEYYIKNKYKMIKNNSSSCNGDLRHNDIDFEIKISMGGKTHNKFNYVQLRMNHNCYYLLIAYYLCKNNLEQFGELFIFKLNKNSIKQLILNYGSYAHGTIHNLGIINKESLNDINNNKEYCLRPKYDDNCWNELLQFRIDEIDI